MSKLSTVKTSSFSGDVGEKGSLGFSLVAEKGIVTLSSSSKTVEEVVRLVVCRSGPPVNNSSTKEAVVVVLEGVVDVGFKIEKAK